jgi:hypothetical protein
LDEGERGIVKILFHSLLFILYIILYSLLFILYSLLFILYIILYSSLSILYIIVHRLHHCLHHSLAQFLDHCILDDCAIHNSGAFTVLFCDLSQDRFSAGAIHNSGAFTVLFCDLSPASWDEFGFLLVESIHSMHCSVVYQPHQDDRQLL